ncbi:hypothetical protein ACHWQZ_G004409 [Mnemiopsis leidyi]
MFGIFRKHKRGTNSNKPAPPDPQLLSPPPPLHHPPGSYQPHHQKNHQHHHAPQHQVFNPVMYVTGPGSESAPSYNPNVNQAYNPNINQSYHHNGGSLYYPDIRPPYSNGSGPYPSNGSLPLSNGSVPISNGAVSPSTHPHSGVVSKNLHTIKHTNIGPPPVQNKWVDLDDPRQSVRKGRRSRGHNPAVVRSNSAGSVKSHASSVGSCYSTKSEQYKNSVRIPDTKFSGSWTSNESVNSRNRSKNSLTKKMNIREWNVDVAPRNVDTKLSAQLAYNTYRAMTAGDLPLKTSLKSLKSSCGNVSSTDSAKHLFGASYLSSSTPPPAYQSDPLSSVHSSNGYINKRTTTQHPSTLPQLQQSNDTMLSGYGSPVRAPGRIVTATLYKTTKGFGFTLSGGDKTGQPVLIKSVKQGSPADTQGGLLAGDILVKVNGQIVSNLTHSGVVQLFKSIPNGAEARLELRRNDQSGVDHHQHHQPYQHYPHQQPYQQQPYPQQQPYHQQPYQQQPYTNGRGYHDQGAESSSSRSTGSVNNPHGDLIPIYIDKGDNGFGFTIHQSTAGQRIKTIMDRSRCAYLMEGDLIIQINSEPLVNKSHGETVHLLKSIPPHTRTLLLISRTDPEIKRKDKKNRSFRSRQPPPPPPPQPVHPPQHHHNNHHMTSSRANPPQNPLTAPRMPLTVPVYGMDSNRISDHGSVQSGSDRQHHQLWESPVRSAGSGGWDPISSFNQGANSWDSTGEYQDIQVNLQKDNNGFGFKVIGGEEQGIPVAIGHVTPEGPAEGLLQIYDEIRSVNGQSVLGAYHTGVLSLIGQAAAFQGKISLIVRRHKNPELLFNMSGIQLPDLNVDLSRYKLVNMRNVTVTKEPEECFGFVIHSSLRAEDTFKIGQVVADSPAGRCPDLLEGDSVLTVNGTPITGLQHRTVVELIKKCGTSVILGVGTPQLVEEDEDSDWRNQTEEISITLERDERGFGFSIRGGKAFQEEDTLFVLRIGKGGVADRDGRLRRGDEIIEINGQSMYEVSHQEAVDKIKSGGSTLNLVVRRRKLEMPPIIQLGLEDKPETLQYPERTEIKSDSRSKNGDTPEKDPTPGSSPAPPHNDPTPEPSMDKVTRDETSDPPQDFAPSRDVTDSSRDVITPRDARHEYDKYEPDGQLPAGTSPAD